MWEVLPPSSRWSMATIYRRGWLLEPVAWAFRVATQWSVYIVILIWYERLGILITFMIEEVYCVGTRYPGTLRERGEKRRLKICRHWWPNWCRIATSAQLPCWELYLAVVASGTTFFRCIKWKTETSAPRTWFWDGMITTINIIAITHTNITSLIIVTLWLESRYRSPTYFP